MKEIFALLRLFIFVTFVPMLSLSLVSCDPDAGAEDAIENVGGNEGATSYNDSAGGDSEEGSENSEGDTDKGSVGEDVENSSSDSDVDAGTNDEETDEGDTPVTPGTISAVAVDLGLTIKWASCNVGATSPEEYGGFYAWGETEEKSDNSWATYKWCNGSYDTQIKYCTSGAYGIVDNKTTLEPEDDVAHVQWGGNWRMPTWDEFEELRKNCDWEWVVFNGVSGYKVKSRVNENFIFLPAAGYRKGAEVFDRGIYWSATLHPRGRCRYASALQFYDSYYEWTGSERYCDQTVRPVTD